MKRTILCVGNCGYDQSTLNAYLRSRFDVDVLAADRASEADSLLSRRDVDLALVNRVFDRDGDSGIDWIRRRFDRSGPSPRFMLISGYEDAQREAVKAGAVPGFGKSDLRGDLPAERIAAALETREEPPTGEMQGESESSSDYS